MRKKYNFIDDGYNSELVEKTLFNNIFEIPEIEKPEKIIIPKSLTPFSERKKSKDRDTAICFYEHDYKFADIVYNTASFVSELKNYSAFVSPDCSLYRDMPLCLQITNTYFNRAIGSFIQNNGIYTIPNVRWSDERTYTTCKLPEKVAFLGVPKNSIVSIGTYGCIKGNENKYYFKAGLDAMLRELTPKVVLVYGNMPDDIFENYVRYTKFIQYKDWISARKGGNRNGNN